MIRWWLIAAYERSSTCRSKSSPTIKPVYIGGGLPDRGQTRMRGWKLFLLDR